MSDEILIRLEERLKAHCDRYERDREETTKRYETERDERKGWRDEINMKVDRLEKKIGPVVRDHQFIVRGGKWVAATCAAGFGAVKGWIFLKEHIR